MDSRSFQATEVIRRQSKFREASTESLAKLKNAETRLSELKSSVLVLGKEATDAMLSVKEEQQQITFQKLLTMVLLVALCSFNSYACYACRSIMIGLGVALIGYLA